MSRIGASSRRGFLQGCAVGALSALSGAAFADERRPVVVEKW
jgi:hypothetical protein